MHPTTVYELTIANSTRVVKGHVKLHCRHLIAEGTSEHLPLKKIPGLSGPPNTSGPGVVYPPYPHFHDLDPYREMKHFMI